MAHKWTEEELNIIETNYQLGATKLHSLLPNIAIPAIRYKLKTLGLNTVKYNWTKEDLALLKDKHTEYTVKEFSELLNRSSMAIRMQLSRLGIKAKDDKKGPAIGSIYTKRNQMYTNDDLLSILSGLENTSRDWYNINKLQDWPASSTIANRFGGWTKALEAAGILPNKGVQSFDKPTTVYLLRFNDFYKVGITQQSIKCRFSGYPEYDIIAQKRVDLSSAKSIESTVLEIVKPYQYIPDCFPQEGRGFTECFKVAAPILSQCLVYFQE